MRCSNTSTPPFLKPILLDVPHNRNRQCLPRNWVTAAILPQVPVRHNPRLGAITQFSRPGASMTNALTMPLPLGPNGNNAVTKTNVAYIITHRHIGHHSSHCNFTHSLPYTSLCSKPTLPNPKLTLQPRTESLAMQMSPEMQLSQSQGKCQTPDCTKNHQTV